MNNALSTEQVIRQLEGEGFDVTWGYIQFLMRERHLKPPERVGRALIWHSQDVERLKILLRKRGRLPHSTVRRSTKAGQDNE